MLTVIPTAISERHPTTIKIWQQNVNKSQTCQHDIISSGKLAKEGIDIVALQEPAINYFGGTVTAKDWTVLLPPTHSLDPTKTRSLILVRTNIITDSWSQIDINSGDITAVLLQGTWGRLAIYNAYIDCAHDQGLEILVSATKAYEEESIRRADQLSHKMWLGDFNRHHPHWDNPSDTRLFTQEALKNAEKLISAVADAGLDLALPPQQVTHRHNVTKKWSRLDHVFISEHSTDTIISCDTLRHSPGICTDHLPILTTLDLAVAHAPIKVIENFREVDWEKFRADLAAELTQLGPPQPIRNQSSLDRECSKLTQAMQSTITGQVPTSEICPKSKRWWTKELTALRRTANRLGRRVSKLKGRLGDPLYAEYENAKREYAREIERNKRQHWRDWLERAEDPDIWTAHRYVSATTANGTSTRIPTLRKQSGESERIASTNEEKSKMLGETFFPTPSVTEAEVEQETPEGEPVCDMDEITKDQILKHLARLKPYKAPGPDGIPNIVLTKCADLLLDRLYYIYRATVERGLFYEPWKKFTTVVLRKPGKPKYSIPKAYRPIALINTQVKVLTAILAEQLMFYAERYNLLPENHFGGRKGRNAVDAIQVLVHRIKNEWRKGNVVSVLFLDIEGAFPNANNNQLLGNLTKRGIPKDLITFVANMLKDRSTVLRFDGYTSDAITLNNGIGQGDPLSMALYQFYNADLLDIPEGKEEAAIAYVDDAILIVSSPSFHGAHDKLAAMMTRKGGAIDWAEKHNSRFEFSKLALIDFAHHSKDMDRPHLILPDCTVKPTESTKYLGVILDQSLKWNEQLAYVAGKGSTWAAQIRRVTRPTWGLTPRSARKLYVGVALPRILYGIEVWHPPQQKSKHGGKPPVSAATRKLTTVQREGALAVTGGFRTSPIDTLNAHAALLPMHLRIERIKFSKAVRMASLPPTHPLHKQIRAAARRRIRRHRSPLHELAEILKSDPDSIEEIPVVRANPAHKSKNPIKVSIPASKDASVSEDAHAREEIKVYTDGSIHGGKVGAAAVLYRKGRRQRELRLHLGAASEHTIYEAELVGLILGMQLIKTEKQGKTDCAIGADNQAAIIALESELTKPGQHLAAEFLKLAGQVARARRKGKYSLVVRWTTGHSGIKGNEEADKEAKTAAEGNSSAAKDLPAYIRKTIKKSTSALKQDNNKRLNEAWKAEWNESERYKRFKAPDIISPASKKFLALISDHRIPKHMASLIFQLRVGHAPLNGYLHRFERVNSARCPACGAPRETTEHFLLRCPKYAHERWALLKHIKDSEPKVERILSNPKTIIPLVNYIDATERFKSQGNNPNQGQGQEQAQT
jgi:ribonuclease HI